MQAQYYVYVLSLESLATSFTGGKASVYLETGQLFKFITHSILEGLKCLGIFLEKHFKMEILSQNNSSLQTLTSRHNNDRITDAVILYHIPLKEM